MIHFWYLFIAFAYGVLIVCISSKELDINGRDIRVRDVAGIILLGWFFFPIALVITAFRWLGDRW